MVKTSELVSKAVQQRRRKGIKQEVIAQRLGVSQGQVSKMERGERQFELHEFCTYCALVGLVPFLGVK